MLVQKQSVYFSRFLKRTCIFSLTFASLFFFSQQISPQKKIAVGTKKNEQKVTTILLAGDIHFSFATANLLDRSYRNPLSRLIPIFAQADYRLINLETTLYKKGLPAAKIKYPFTAHPKALKILKKLDINMVNLANNHAMDYGKDSLALTMKNLKKTDISFVGAGKNENQAMRPVPFTVNGIDFTVFAVSMVGRRFIYATESTPGVASHLSIAEIRNQAQKKDQVIVSLHWGVEYYKYPKNTQIKYARKLIDNGADIVFGHHPHIPQGIEFYGDGVIIYSLGNLSFGTYHELQDHNIIVLADFNQTTKRLFQIRILPINGRYFENGHNVFVLTVDERDEFLKSYWALIDEKFSSTAARATIENGVMVIRKTGSM